MIRHAIIDTTSDKVVNIVEYAQALASQTPPGFEGAALIAVQSDTAQIGDGWNGSAIVPQSQPTPAPIPLSQQAMTELAKSDLSMLRIHEAVALGKNTVTGADVVTFVNYRRALRAIVDGTDTASTSLPVRPAYPAGT